MKECHCVIACAVRKRGPVRGNAVKKKMGKKRGEEEEVHQAAALPQGSPQECNPAQGAAAGATQARRAGLAVKGTHTVHTCAHKHILLLP